MNLEGGIVFLGAGMCMRKPPKLLGQGVAPEGARDSVPRGDTEEGHSGGQIMQIHGGTCQHNDGLCCCSCC